VVTTKAIKPTASKNLREFIKVNLSAYGPVVREKNLADFRSAPVQHA
jgi:hypothetical protein